MKKALIAVAALAVVAGLGLAAWLLLKPESTVTALGTCDGAVYQLEAEPDDGVLEVTFELQSGGPDEVWMVTVDRDGATLLDGERRTDADGELEVDVVVREDGPDDFSVVATPMTDGTGGTSCNATLER